MGVLGGAELWHWMQPRIRGCKQTGKGKNVRTCAMYDNYQLDVAAALGKALRRTQVDSIKEHLEGFGDLLVFSLLTEWFFF